MNDKADSSGELIISPISKRDDLFRFGVVLTGLWLTFGILVMFFGSDRTNTPKPNEWGDVFAGLFAPVAFLWLVLGFRQQGRELQLNTRALELQARELQASVRALNLQAQELRNSVEQQAALVDVSRQQVEATLSEQERRRAAELAATQPRFVLRPTGSGSSSGGSTMFNFELTNEGESVSNVYVVVTPPPQNDPSLYGAISRDQTVRCNLQYPNQFPENGATFVLSYDDINGQSGQARFIARLEAVGANSRAMRVMRMPAQ